MIRPPSDESRAHARRCAIEQARLLTRRGDLSDGSYKGTGKPWGATVYATSIIAKRSETEGSRAPAEGANAQVRDRTRTTRTTFGIACPISAGSGFESLMAHKPPGQRSSRSLTFFIGHCFAITFGGIHHVPQRDLERDSSLGVDCSPSQVHVLGHRRSAVT